MDPFAAMGAASAIITFLDFGATLVKTAKEIHASASGASKDNADLEDLTKRMEELSLNLKPTKNRSHMTIIERDLMDVCTKCDDLSADLLKVLSDVKPKTPGSKRSNLAATFRTFMNASRLKALGLKLQEYRSLLQIQLGKMTRLVQALIQSSTSMILVLIVTRDELGPKLDDIINTGNILGSDLQPLIRNTKVLRSGVTVKSLEPTALEQVRMLLAQSDQAIEKAGQILILKRLQDETMDLRFSDVPQAHANTLSWIFQDSDTYDEKLKARTAYNLWLRKTASETDKSIFHICGKPGAGKSTLVKYLCTQQATMDGLREWASAKTLVVCRYFAWKPGTTVQNTIKGLERTLLYHILQQAPQLCKVAFESQWQNVKEHHMLEDGYEERRKGLQAIQQSKRTFVDRKFCFFIDGLDEFHEEPEDVVRFLQDWATLGGHNIKICVSSRELFIFRERFKSCLKLTLQDINYEDIALRIEDGLQALEDLETRDDKDEILALGRVLARKSEGVFLWATLTLSTVQESVLSDESAAEIARKIDSLPIELEDVFQYIFDTIKTLRYESDRRMAMMTLQLILEHQRPLRRGFKDLSLIRYSFLDEYDADHRFVHRKQLHYTTEKEVNHRLEKAQKQIQRRCFGLVEVRVSKKLGFVHRAVVEFMTRSRTSQAANEFITGFDVLDFMRQSFVATIKLITPPLDYFEVGSKRPVQDALELCWLDPPTRNGGRNNFLESGILDSVLALSRFQKELIDVLDQSSMLCSDEDPMKEAFIHDVVEIGTSKSQPDHHVTHGLPENASGRYFEACSIADAVLLAICSGANLELVQPALALSRRQYEKSRLSGSMVRQVGLETQLMYALSAIPYNCPEQLTFNILDHLFMGWCQNRRDLPHDEIWGSVCAPTLWQRIVWSGFWSARDGDYDSFTAPLEPIIRIFLLYGAPPDMAFRVSRCRDKHDRRCYWRVRSVGGPFEAIIRRGILHTRLEAYLLVQARNAEIELTLRELVYLWFPHQRARTLQYLIDQSAQRGRPPSVEEVLEMKSHKDLDVDVQNGITHETDYSDTWVPAWKRRPDKYDPDWEEWVEPSNSLEFTGLRCHYGTVPFVPDWQHDFSWL
ncbi:hypothetical protein PG985_007667 [Apiospora marii]|uniref:uncharacterized protein n=1 Tax=Apiospora marii TaxID=335849 RepID=UPI0031315910